ncbi:MAG: DUF397 domain-containing protein [Streptosporangiales bacterium]|nr:DUF397 domain-containing protein [Streptosporangiales bacterium]
MRSGAEAMLVRDSGDRAGVMLSFGPGPWAAFLGRVRCGG